MQPQAYFDLVPSRLQASGYVVTPGEVGGRSVVIGYRSDFRLKWAATKLHLFVVIGSSNALSGPELEQFANTTLDFAVSQKGRFRGFQSGVAALPALVALSVDESAIDFAKQTLIRRFSTFAWPVAVDLGAEQLYCHEGRVVVGGIYANWLRSQARQLAPAV